MTPETERPYRLVKPLDDNQRAQAAAERKRQEDAADGAILALAFLVLFSLFAFGCLALLPELMT